MHRRSLAGRVSATSLIVVAAVAAAIGFWLASRSLAPRAATPAAMVAYPSPRALPAFSLVASDGSALTRADLEGRWTLFFFGYTHCPDVCPTTLATFARVLRRLRDDGVADRVAFVFVSVDPARDTHATIARYLSAFDAGFVGATGDDADLARLTRALGLVYSRASGNGGDYAVDHSASVVVVDPKAREVGLFRPPFDVDAIARDLERLAGNTR